MIIAFVITRTTRITLISRSVTLFLLRARFPDVVAGSQVNGSGNVGQFGEAGRALLLAAPQIKVTEADNCARGGSELVFSYEARVVDVVPHRLFGVTRITGCNCFNELLMMLLRYRRPGTLRQIDYGTTEDIEQVE